jgi:hypothetical protein
MSTSEKNMKNSGPFSEYHLMILLTYYIDNKRPTSDEICEIAEKLERSKDSIRRWFRRKLVQENNARREKRAEKLALEAQMSYSRPAEKKRKTSYFSEVQRTILRTFFKTNQSPNSEEMNLLCQTLGCEIKPVERWFRLKIQTERRKSKEVDKNPPKIAESDKTEEESEIISTAISENLFCRENEENSPKKDQPQEREEEFEIISITVSQKLFYGGPILRWDGKVVGRVTAEEVRQYF